jgi:tetratricopeptide (TPR) repeat protein
MSIERSPGERPTPARLEQALEVFLAAPPASRAEAERMLAAHPALADLLGPMVDAGTSPEPTAAREERVLGDFRLVRELGRGGMGIVYEAWQRSLDRRVAVKVLSPGLVANPTAVARLRREAAAAGRLRHPNIVEIYGSGSDGDQHFFAMQFVDGEPLQRCGERFRGPSMAIALATQLTDALAHAHAQGLVHRDVKPSNVLVQDDDKALLTDFGVARDETLPSLTVEGGFLGTVDYASPEQVRGQPVDARTDLWAVGVLLHELLVGQTPFSAPTQEALLHAILTKEPPSLVGRPGVSRDLAAVVDRCLQKDRRRRYQSAKALLSDLQALANGDGVSARLPSTFERFRRWTAREPWRAVAAAALAIGVPALAATGGFLWANAPRIAAAEAAEFEEQRERALAEAWLHAHNEAHEDGLRALATAPAAANGDEEVACARAWLLWRLGRDKEADNAIAEVGTPPAIRLRDAIAGRTTSQPTLEPRSAFDAFLSAQLLIADPRAKFFMPRRKSRERIDLLRSATLQSPRQRLVNYVAWANACIAVDDMRTASDLAVALVTQWPNEQVAKHVHFRVIAETEPKRAIGMWPSLSPALQRGLHLSHALAFEAAGDLAAAEQANAEGLARQPKMHRGHANQSAVLRKLKRPREAVAAAETAVALYAEHPHYWQLLGLARRDEQDLPGAAAAFERSAALDADYAVPLYQLGNLRKESGDWTGAIAAFREAAARDPQYVQAIANLGDALQRGGRVQEALPYAIRAATLRPNDLIPNYNVATIAMTLGLIDLALPAAAHAAAVAPKDPRAHVLHADALLASPTADKNAAVAAARTADELGDGENLAYRLLVVKALVAAEKRDEARSLLTATAAEPRRANDIDRQRIAALRDELGLRD